MYIFFALTRPSGGVWDVLKIREKKMFCLPKVKNNHDDAIDELLDEAGLVVIALPLLVAKHLLNIECVVR